MVSIIEIIFTGFFIVFIVTITIIVGIVLLIVWIMHSKQRLKELENPETKKAYFEKFRYETIQKLDKIKLENINLSENINKISAIKEYLSSIKGPTFRKSIISFFTLDQQKNPIIAASGLFVPITLLPNIKRYNYDGILIIKTNEGYIKLELFNRILSIYFNENKLGFVDLNKKIIYDNSGKKIGYTKRKDFYVSNINIGLKYLPEIHYPVFIKNKRVCEIYANAGSITEMESSARAGPILEHLDLKLKKEFKILLLALGVHEAFFFDYIQIK